MKKVLIIDNSKFIANVIKYRIDEQSNYEVFTTQTLQRARDLLENDSFFMIVSNLVLEDADEGDILDFIKHTSIPSILFSSSIKSKLINDANYPNILDYVFKDYNGAMHICNLLDAVSFGMNKKILVVDDSKTSVMYMQKILQKLLMKIYSAEDGYEALAYLKQNQDTTLLISDMNMPKMNGFELTKAVRANTDLADLKIIITTGQTDDKTKIDLYKYGADDVIYKPVVAEEMTYKVVSFLLEQKYIADIKRFNNIADEHILSSHTDNKGTITAVSQALCDVSGYQKHELIGQSHSIFKHPDMSSVFFDNMWQKFKEGQKFKGEIKNRKKDGGYFWVDGVIEPLIENDGTITGYYAMYQDITDKKIVERISITDGLTGLYNRRHFNDMFDKMVNTARREEEVLCFLLMDIDFFKQYNDNYGHQAGDEVLIKFSQCLQSSLKRADDMAFRLGGEEFGVLYKAKTKQKGYRFANLILENIQNLDIKHAYSKAADHVTASMGLVAEDAAQIKSMDEVYKQADDLLYRSKDNGRDQINANI